MKKFIPIFIAIIIAGIVIAADSITVSTTNSGITSNTITTIKCDGFIESVHITPSLTSTSDVAILVGTEVVYTNAGLTGSANVRPRLPITTTAGGAYAVGTNQNARMFLCNDVISIRIAELNALTNTTKVVIKIDDK